VWRLLIEVELLCHPSWSVKDVFNIGVREKLEANILPEVSVTWRCVVFVKTAWPIFGHAQAVRRRLLILVLQVRSQDSSGVICDTQGNAGTSLSPNTLIFLLLVQWFLTCCPRTVDSLIQ
jgi:hypothetical protein